MTPTRERRTLSARLFKECRNRPISRRKSRYCVLGAHMFICRTSYAMSLTEIRLSDVIIYCLCVCAALVTHKRRIACLFHFNKIAVFHQSLFDLELHKGDCMLLGKRTIAGVGRIGWPSPLARGLAPLSASRNNCFRTLNSVYSHEETRRRLLTMAAAISYTRFSCLHHNGVISMPVDCNLDSCFSGLFHISVATRIDVVVLVLRVYYDGIS